MQAFRHLPVPYTVVLLGFGMFLGMILATNSDADDSTTQTELGGLMVRTGEIWSELDAHLMLHIFLPPLVFESAFAMEWRIFNQCKWFCIFLAGPCMLAATYATGSLANLLLMPREEGRWYSLPGSITGLPSNGASRAPHVMPPQCHARHVAPRC